MTPKEVAEYMLQEMGDSFWLYQETIVYKIQKNCGDEFVYNNANGNLAIDKKVLKEFHSLTKGTLGWDRGSRAWRRRKDSDKPGRQVD